MKRRTIDNRNSRIETDAASLSLSMKAVLVSMILGFGTLQMVSFVQCCCGPLCTTPGEVCKDHEHESEQKLCTSCDGDADSTSGQSSKEEDGNTKRCTHLGPATELSQAQSDHAVHAPLVEDLVIEPSLLGFEEQAPLTLRESVPRSAPSRPLYILTSALLI